MSVHFVHGDKGGVGKSFVAASFTDWLIARRMVLPLVVDCDMRNPDLARMFAETTTTEHVDLAQHEGWLELLSLLEEHDNAEVVVCLPSGVGGHLVTELPDFFVGAAELSREVNLLWTLSRTPDSINLLRPAMLAFTQHARAMVVIKNLYFGDSDRFERWNDSKTRTKFEAANGLVVEFPALIDRLVDRTSNAIPPVQFSSKIEGLRFGERNELARWLEKVDAMWMHLSSSLGLP